MATSDCSSDEFFDAEDELKTCSNDTEKDKNDNLSSSHVNTDQDTGENQSSDHFKSDGDIHTNADQDHHDTNNDDQDIHQTPSSDHANVDQDTNIVKVSDDPSAEQEQSDNDSISSQQSTKGSRTSNDLSIDDAAENIKQAETDEQHEVEETVSRGPQRLANSADVNKLIDSQLNLNMEKALSSDGASSTSEESKSVPSKPQHLTSSLDIDKPTESQPDLNAAKTSSSDRASHTSDESKKSEIRKISFPPSSDSSSNKDIDSRSEASDEQPSKVTGNNVERPSQSQTEVSSMRLTQNVSSKDEITQGDTTLKSSKDNSHDVPTTPDKKFSVKEDLLKATRKKHLHLSEDSASPSRVQRDMTVESALEGARIVKTAEPTSPKQDKPHEPPCEKKILQGVMVKDLDTGVEIPLSEAEKHIPTGANPLSVHIMKITSELSREGETKEETKEEVDDKQEDKIDMEDKSMEKKKGFRHFLGRRTKRKKKGDDGQKEEDDEVNVQSDHTQQIKYKAASHHKGPYEFSNTKLLQDLSGEHTGPIWTMSFSNCGKLLASGGQDTVVRIWVLKICSEYFKEMLPNQKKPKKKTSTSQPTQGSLEEGPFLGKPLCIFNGHTADILDLSWSRNYFLLSSSMDKSVRLWHVSQKECLCCFLHTDFVAAIAFHPLDDRYFLSGSFDGKLRLWNIPKKKVAMWNEIDASAKLITATNFCQRGKYAVIGTYDGRCIFYDTEQLKYHTQIHVRSSRGRNSKGRKICGIIPMPGSDKILVTSNDSRIRLYDLKDFKMTCKYKGCLNTSSQIRASFNQSGESIVCGSEDYFVYTWKTYHDYAKSSSRRDRNDCFESFQAHTAIVTSAVFVPVPSMAMQFLNVLELYDGEVVVTADYQGNIKVLASCLEE